MQQQEVVGSKIKCQYCRGKIEIPGPLAQNPSRYTFYCPYCGQYTRTGKEESIGKT